MNFLIVFTKYQSGYDRESYKACKSRHRKSRVVIILVVEVLLNYCHISQQEVDYDNTIEKKTCEVYGNGSPDEVVCW